MNFLSIATLLILVSQNAVAQTTEKAGKRNYCNYGRCQLAPDDPAHFDPYYNGHLCENFNPEQLDFSKEYFELQSSGQTKTSNKLQTLMKCDFAPIWLSRDVQHNGVLGRNCQRIQIHVDEVKAGANKTRYLMSGRSKVNSNICNFKGELELLSVYFGDCEDTGRKKCGRVFARYTLYEDSSQAHAGIFRGISESLFYIDSTGKWARLDESTDVADGYWNRTFVGTWTEYNTGIAKKCIWGDYRLPFTFDFDCGDGVMIVCDRYKKNGWESFNDDSEFVVLTNGKIGLKNKWWLRKK